MTVKEKTRLLGFLEERSQRDWISALDEIASAIHPVDREATRIWFAFWPLELRDALGQSPDAKNPMDMARLMDLEGNLSLIHI